ncbi:MAG: leucine-rich repeat domain-containing protein, partial [Clostridiales bacterium]|nr:leucine-rich repeat domain-containing protein [Clostridiales bacterium]
MMKRILSLFLSIIMLCSITAGLDFSVFAAEPAGANGIVDSAAAGTLVDDSATGTDGNIKWSIYDDGRLVLELADDATGTTMSAYTASSASPWSSSSWASSIKYVVIGYGITALGAYAFNNMTQIESVAVETKNAAGEDPADGDIEYTTLINYGNAAATTTNTRTFYGCTGITALQIPGNISYGTKDLGLFTDCTGVTSVTFVCAKDATYGAYIGNGLNGTAATAFTTTTYKYTPWYLSSNAGNTVDITLLRGMERVYNYAFYALTIGTYTAPCDIGYGTNGTASNSAFYNSSINEVVLTAGTKYNILGPANSTTNAFTTSTAGTAYTHTPWYGSGAETVTLSADITSIGNYAFYGCSKLKNITMASGVYCNTNSFTNCSAVESVTVLGSGAVNYNGSDYTAETYTYSPYYQIGRFSSGFSVAFAEGITEIGAYAFYNAPITSIDMTNITSVGEYAFGGAVEKVVYGGDIAGWCALSFANSQSNPLAGGNSELYIGGGVNAFGTDSATISINTSVGDYAFYNYGALACALEIGGSAESIGAGAFYGTGITSVSISSGVNSIADDSFAYTNSVAKITVDQDNTSYCSVGDVALYNIDKTTLIKYAGANSQTAFTVPDTVTYIGPWALTNASNLTDLTIPVSAEMSSESTATEGLSLEKITLTASSISTEIADYTSISYQYTPWYVSKDTLQSVVIDSGITAIGSWAFCGMEIDIDIPDSVTSVGAYAFYGDTALDLQLGSAVTYIGQNAFYNTAFYNDSINWEDGVLYYDTYVIAANESDMSSEYEIKDGTTLLAAYSFNNFDVEITVPSSVEYINEYALQNATIGSESDFSAVKSVGQNAFYGCTSLTGDFSAALTEIGAGAFYGCENLSGIDLSNVTSIENKTFALCTALTSVSLDSAVSIGECAFQNCTALKTVSLGESVETIGYMAFAGCTALQKVIVNNSEAAISNYSSTIYQNATIYGWTDSSAQTYAETWGRNFIALDEMCDYIGAEHTPAEAVIENSVAASCTTDGSYDSVVYCSVCGEEISRTAITVPAHHTYESVVTAPTCTAGGYTTYTCTVCGDSYVADET